MLCRRRSWDAAAGRPAPSSASPMFCLRLYRDGAAARRARRLGHAGGAHLSPRRNFPRIRADATFDDALARAARRSCRNSWPHAALRMPRPPGYEADDFLAAAAAAQESGAAERPWSRAAIATRFSSPPDSTTILYPVRAGEMARIGPAEVRARYGVDPGQVRISSRCAVTRRTSCPEPAVLVRPARRRCCASTAPWKPLSAAGRFAAQADSLRLFRWIATMNRSAPLAQPAQSKADVAAGRPRWRGRGS
mgnify:CR=1 FL=1